MYSNILVAIDGSEISYHAFDEAIKLAKMNDGKLHAIYVIDVNIKHPGPDDESVREILHRRFEEEGTNTIDEIKARAAENGIAVDIHLETGSAGEVIVKTAAALDCDLVVAGSVGKSLLDRIFLGSVSTYISKNVKTNFLIIRK